MAAERANHYQQAIEALVAAVEAIERKLGVITNSTDQHLQSTQQPAAPTTKGQPS